MNKLGGYFSLGEPWVVRTLIEERSRIDGSFLVQLDASG